jgi:ATP/maltotriose-dependent transcriptional regulator MalT
MALAMSGESARAQQLAEDLNRRFQEDTGVQFNYLPTLRAQLALNHGEPAKAIELLEKAAPYELGTTRVAIHANFGALYPVYVRGEAYLAMHKASEAVAEFQKILDHRGVVVSDPVSVLARLQLARAYVMQGDNKKAGSAYQELLAEWKDADGDLALVKRAQGEDAGVGVRR